MLAISDCFPRINDLQRIQPRGWHYRRLHCSRCGVRQRLSARIITSADCTDHNDQSGHNRLCRPLYFVVVDNSRQCRSSKCNVNINHFVPLLPRRQSLSCAVANTRSVTSINCRHLKRTQTMSQTLLPSSPPMK